MSGTWEPAGSSKDDGEGFFFGEVDGIVYRDTDNGPAELRYKGGAADIYEEVPEAKPAPQKRRWRSEGIWSPGAEQVEKKQKSRNRAAIKRFIPLFTMLGVMLVMAGLFWYIGNLLLSPQ